MLAPALLLSVLAAQLPDGAVTATTAVTSSAAAVATPAPPPAPPPEAAPPPPAPPAVAATPAPPLPTVRADAKSVPLAWLLSFGLGLGLGNWYAEAPGHAIFVAIGELAGAAMMIASDGPGRSAGLVTLLVSWALDWTSALRNARLYNEAHQAQAAGPQTTTPERVDSGSDLAPAHQVSVSLSF